MFRLLNKQGVESDRGFVVQFTGRFTLEYRHENFRMECDADGLPDGTTYVSLPELPFGNLTEKRRSEIANDIREALEFMGLSAEIH